MLEGLSCVRKHTRMYWLIHLAAWPDDRRDVFRRKRLPPPACRAGGEFNAYLRRLALSLKWSDGCGTTDGDVGCFQELLMARYDPKWPSTDSLPALEYTGSPAHPYCIKTTRLGRRRNGEPSMPYWAPICWNFASFFPQMNQRSIQSREMESHVSGIDWRFAQQTLIL